MMICTLCADEIFELANCQIRNFLPMVKLEINNKWSLNKALARSILCRV